MPFTRIRFKPSSIFAHSPCPAACRNSIVTLSTRTSGIRYLWMPALGGYRKKIRDDSPNIAIRNASFRNYADYMLTSEFEKAMAELIGLAQNSRTAYMCAERLYFRCHRMLVSDWLLAHGHEVLHIDGSGPVKSHGLSADARLVGTELIYRGDRLL
jgi:uncharacterized protein (DUF488 family)